MAILNAHETKSGNTTAKNNSKSGLCYAQLCKTATLRGVKQVTEEAYSYDYTKRAGSGFSKPKSGTTNFSKSSSHISGEW